LSRIIERRGIKEADWIAQEAQKTVIPPLLSEDVLKSIPEGITGVYYFYNQHGYIIYVGKALDIKKRMMQHFAINGKESAKAIQMKAELADIKYKETGDELLALLLESDEIKKWKPIYNVMQKRSRAVPFFGIFNSYDDKGYIIFDIRKLKEGDEPMTTADSIHSAKEVLQNMVERYNLCETKCHLHNMNGPCFNYHLHQCNGACMGDESPEDYNLRAIEAIKRYSFHLESFLIIGKGRNENEKSVVCVERGQYKGFGYCDSNIDDQDVSSLKSCIQCYSHNRDIQQILCVHLRQQHIKVSYDTVQSIQ
jgi:DNA polymerase-3 subunit epsilon